MSGPHPLMTPAEAAAMLQCSRKTVDRYAASGKLASFRLPGDPGHRRFFRAQVVAYRQGKPLTPAQVRKMREQWLATALDGDQP